MEPEQKAFLEEDLATTRKRWKIVFLHRSPYGSSRHGGDEKVREELEPVFVRHGVDVVFSGHDHVYERTVPIRGVTYVVSGGGGRRLYRAGKSAWTASSKSAHHAVLVRIDGVHLSGGNRTGRYCVGPLGSRKSVKDTPPGDEAI